MSVSKPSPHLITAVEAVTPLGFDAAQSGAAIRAGMNRFADHPFQIGLVNDPETENPEPLIASLLEELDPDLEGPERLMELAVPALKGVLARSRLKRADLAKGALCLSLPAADPGMEGADASLAGDLVKRVGIGTLAAVRTCREGHTGFAACLAEASRLLAEGKAEFCLVGGLETYHSGRRLDALDRDWRLKSARAVDGFIPGEAAVFLVLETAAGAARRGAAPLASLAALGFGREPRAYASESLSSGQGLGQALEPALALPAEPGRGRWVLCDLNGESYRAAEWGIVRTRLGAKLDPIAALTHPADCLGDTGAASGGVLAAYALHAFGRGCAPAREALIWNASDDGARSALTLTAAERD